MRLTKASCTFALLALLAVANGSYARASTLSISLDTALNNSTANTHTGTATDKREFNSTLSTIQGVDSTPALLGNSVSVATRLASLTLADKDSNTNTIQSANTQNATVNYTLTISIPDPGAGVVYDLVIDTSRIGELTVLNESTGHGGNATLTLGAVTATYAGPGTPVGSNNLAAASYTSPNSNNNTEWFHTAVNQSGSVLVSGLTGAQVITLGFSWAQNVTSINAGGLFNNGQGDDGAIRLGGFHSTNASSGLYPGANGRDQAGDGHFVTVTATVTEIVVIPEPSTLAMTLVAGLGLAIFGWRRRVA